MPLPVAPPIKPMLAKLQPEIPSGGGWIYEPKWDGFRAIVYRDGAEITLASRNNRPLGRYFPEVERALKDALPRTCVIDGEIIIASDEGLEFDALQLRLHPAASRVEKLSGEIPAGFVAFDVLGHGKTDLRDKPLSDRLARLDKILDGHEPPTPAAPATTPGTHVFLTPRTSDHEEATRWFHELEDVRLDGLIAKRDDLKYVAGERVMVKIKHRRTADCVVAGYRLHKDGKGIGSLLLGLYDGDRLHYIGHTSSFKAAERRAILELLKPLETELSFDGDWGPGGPSRWQGQKDTAFVALRPELVCEVSYDFMQGDWRFRHAATFVAWRDDKEPRDCTFDQVRR